MNAPKPEIFNALNDCALRTLQGQSREQMDAILAGAIKAAAQFQGVIDPKRIPDYGIKMETIALLLAASAPLREALMPEFKERLFCKMLMDACTTLVARLQTGTSSKQFGTLILQYGINTTDDTIDPFAPSLYADPLIVDNEDDDDGEGEDEHNEDGGEP